MIADRFEWPAECRVGQRIAKSLFGEADAFEAADRRLFAKDVEEARCEFVIDAAKAKLVAQVDDERDWSCLAVIVVKLRTGNHATRIAELIHRAMPYPLLVEFKVEERFAFSMAEKRLSRDGRGTTVIESQVLTIWHAKDELDAFFAATTFAQFDGRTVCELYRWLWNRLEALSAADVTGVFSVATSNPKMRRDSLARIRDLDVQIAELRKQAKPSLTLAETIDLNMRIKVLIRTRESAKSNLG